jgi:aflatoxin B1 aldehyde reductase
MNPILGTMNIEYPHSSLLDKSLTNYQNIIKTYVEQTHDPILDTAYYYGNCRTEIVLGEILENLEMSAVKIATKANPWFNNDFTSGKLGQLSKDNLEYQLKTSLKNLKVDRVEFFYLHCPDYETPIKETLEKCDELWRKEKFNYLGISNFSKMQMKEVLDICEANAYNSPLYYQGMYNLISRKVEEIFPLLDDYSIEFWGYNPLAGGLLTGKYTNLETDSRFKNNKIYQNIFWKDEIINCDFFKLENCTEYAYKWLQQYSKMAETDKLIIGASTNEQLEHNLHIFNKKVEYDETIIKYLNKIYFKIEHVSPNYYY